MHNIVKTVHCTAISTFCLILPIIAILFLYSQPIFPITCQILASFSSRILISAKMLAYRHISNILNKSVIFISNFPDNYSHDILHMI